MLSDLSSPETLAILLAGCVVVTLIPRLFPLYAMKGDPPPLFRDWLGFVPAAVMAALVAPDILFYGGSFNVDPLGNLFLVVSAATLVFALFVKNYGVVIIFGMVLVAGARFLGIAA